MCSNKNTGAETPAVTPDHKAWCKGSFTRRLCAAMAQPPEPPQAKAGGSLGLKEAEFSQSLESGHLGAQESKASVVTVERAGVQASRG